MDNPQHAKGDFLPDLCSVQAVFSLILVGELLSFAFVLIDDGLSPFQWPQFGTVSFLVQWIILTSAASICPLRPWFKHQNGVVAGMISYGLVLFFTALFTVIGDWLSTRRWFAHPYAVVENLAIAAIFAGVVLRYFYLQQQLHNREQAELRSRLQALQARIRPHFLFNSMNSIASLIDIEPKAAEKMVEDLSELFRASLRDAELVTLQDEISVCEHFIAIEAVRLGPRLKVEWQIDIDVEKVVIPSLMLQPLIENAIYHGIQPLPEGGVVRVHLHTEATKTSHTVLISVVNPVSTQPVNDRSTGNGVALENIRHRLEAYFGEEGGLQVKQGEAEFWVELHYPLTVREEKHAYSNR